MGNLLNQHHFREARLDGPAKRSLVLCRREHRRPRALRAAEKEIWSARCAPHAPR
jgi:hypothetical protein